MEENGRNNNFLSCPDEVRVFQLSDVRQLARPTVGHFKWILINYLVFHTKNVNMNKILETEIDKN